MDDDDDEEQDAWEVEQILKGSGGAGRQTLRVAERSLQQAQEFKRRRALDAQRAVYVNPVQRRAVTTDDIVGALRQSIDETRQREQQLEDGMRKLTNDMAECKEEADSAARELEGANEEYVFLQKTRDHLCDVLDCLNIKLPYINRIVRQFVDVWSHSARRLTDARALHDEDMERDVVALLDKTQENASKKNKHDDSSRKPKLDEFGRDMSYVAESGRSRRDQQRATRAANLRSKHGDAVYERDRGWLSDDDVSIDERRQTERRAKLLEVAAIVFSDARTEFQTLVPTRDLLASCKIRYPDAYRDAYIALSVPGVFAPYVSLQLLRWSPLEQTTFDAMEWYNQLLDFGVAEDDPDYNLIPTLVEQCVTPYLVAALEFRWNPHSAKQTAAARAVVREAFEHLSSENGDKARQALERVVVQQYAHSSAQHAKQPVVFKVATLPKEHERTVRSHYRARCMRAAKLLTTMCTWPPMLSRGGAKQLRDVAAKHMRECILPWLDQDTRFAVAVDDDASLAHLVLRVLEAFPREWEIDSDIVDNPFLELHFALRPWLRRRSANTNGVWAQLQSLVR
eukprot:TRINITY_DN66592_c2_g1_i1.p1 TRINITY_DN66592_c2_g1~~TRINITY_DN66592_c2_g1_i1.p1  ORF type:complete len:576 (-),score=291.76 TRINITY_DN66592_c2_g1_i1:1346-3052(-)